MNETTEKCSQARYARTILKAAVFLVFRSDTVELSVKEATGNGSILFRCISKERAKLSSYFWLDNRRHNKDRSRSAFIPLQKDQELLFLFPLQPQWPFLFLIKATDGSYIRRRTEKS